MLQNWVQLQLRLRPNYWGNHPYTTNINGYHNVVILALGACYLPPLDDPGDHDICKLLFCTCMAYRAQIQR